MQGVGAAACGSRVGSAATAAAGACGAEETALGGALPTSQPATRPPTMLKASTPGCGRKVRVRREARRQSGPPARSAPATTTDPSSSAWSSSARMSCRGQHHGWVESDEG